MLLPHELLVVCGLLTVSEIKEVILFFPLRITEDFLLVILLEIELFQI